MRPEANALAIKNSCWKQLFVSLKYVCRWKKTALIILIGLLVSAYFIFYYAVFQRRVIYLVAEIEIYQKSNQASSREKGDDRDTLSLVSDFLDADFLNRMKDNITEELLKRISAFYVQKMRLAVMCQLSGQCPVRVLVYECANSKLKCGSVSERLRGLASLFYAAYASNRALVINWRHPADLSQFFEINQEMYGITLDSGQSLVSALLKGVSLKERRHFYFSLSDASVLISSRPIISCTTTSLHLMKQTFDRPIFRRSLGELTSLISTYTKTPQLSYELATFLALRVLLKNPKLILQDAVSKTVLTHDKCLFGVDFEISPNDNVGTVRNCFYQKLVNVSQESGCHGNASVYVSSGSVKVKQWLVANLKNKAFLKIVEPKFKLEAIDNNTSNSSSALLGQQVLLEAFADWLILANRTSRLVITRYSHGEIASTFGSFLAYRKAPTERLIINSQDCNDECCFEHGYRITPTFDDDIEENQRKPL